MDCHEIRMMRRQGAAGLVLLTLFTMSTAGHSQTTLPDDNGPAGSATGPKSVPGQVARPSGGVPRGVVVPRAQVDPGMKVMVPHMPPQSTPVIRPRMTAPGANGVVVPR